MGHRRKLLPLLLLLGVTFSSLTWGGACGRSANATIPGAANSFDSSSYLVLVTTDSVIKNTKDALSVNAFPTSILGNVKTALNALIQAYNVCDLAYQEYHTAALVGQATAAQQAAVTTALDKMQAASANLSTVKGAQ